jgi:hypothetical protein
MTSAVETAQDEVATRARPHARWIVRLARAGYAAKGVLYLIVGGLALKAALGSGGRTTDSGGALGTIRDTTGGRALLAVMGVGLLGYALWAVLSGFLDAEDRGDEPKGIALRIGQAARGLVYGALGIEALRAIGSTASARSGSGEAEHWTARAMALPMGRALVLAGAIVIIGYALYQLWRGVHKNIQKHLRLGGADRNVMVWVIRLARFGIVARAIVFFIIGWFLIRAGREQDAQKASGVAESLATLGSQPYGRLLLGIVAAGLIGYGVWQLANARYREMRVE